MITTKKYLELDKKCPHYNEYEGSEKDKELIVEYNKALVERYPFLLPRNVWTDKVVEDYDYCYTLMDNMPFGWRLAFGDQMLEELREELIKCDFIDKYRITEIKEKYGTLRWYDNGIPVGKLSEEYETIDYKYNNGNMPDYDKETESLVEVSRENYTSIWDHTDWTMEQLHEANKDCIIHYRKYKILEKCKVWDIINKYEKLSGETCIDCGAQNTPMYESKGWINFVCKDCAEKRLNKVNLDEESNYKLEDFFYLPGENNDYLR